MLISAQTGTSPSSVFSDAGRLKQATEGLFPSQKLPSATDKGNLFSREVVNSAPWDTQYNASYVSKKCLTEHKDHKAIHQNVNDPDTHTTVCK